jgi:hypothetical protein
VSPLSTPLSDIGSSTNGTLSAPNLQIGTYNCKVTITDP